MTKLIQQELFNQQKKLSVYRKKSPVYISTLLFSGSLALSGCGDDSSGSSVSNVAVDSSVPSIMQAGEAAQGSVALLSTSTSLTSVDSTDIRLITIADSSSCDPKLTFSPSSLSVTVDGDAEVFNVTAPEGNCEHMIIFSGAGVSTSSNTSNINVITDQAVVTVGLYDTNGDETATIAQGGTLKVKFTPPSDWEGVTAAQSYTVSTTTSGITFTNNPCILTPPTSTACQVTASIGGSVTAANHSFSITQESSAAVPIDESSLTFTVTAGSDCSSNPITVGDYQWAADANLGLQAYTAGVSDVNSTGKMNWNTATGDFLTWLNGQNYCGHNDWTIPTMTQYGCNQVNGAVCDTGVAGGLLTDWDVGSGVTVANYLTSLGFTDVQSFTYWSNDTDGADNAWAIDTNSAFVFTVPKVSGMSQGYFVLPVRSN